MPSALRPTWAAAIVLLAVASSGCYVEGAPSGKNEVLFIDAPEVLARHLENELVIPGERTFYNNNISYKLPRTISYDFAETTLEVEGDGIELLSTDLHAPGAEGSWVARIRCMAPSGHPTEVRVRVMADGHPRYEDATDVLCVEPEALAVDLALPFHQPQPSEVALLGGAFEVQVQVLGTVNGEQRQLAGSGIEPVDPAGAISLTSLEPNRLDGLVLRAERLGKDPLLKAGPVTAAVPVEIVPDDGWEVKVWTEYGASVSDSLQFAGYAELPDGGVPAGLYGDCAFRITPEVGEVHLRGGECTGFVMHTADAGQVCVDVRGRSHCAEW